MENLFVKNINRQGKLMVAKSIFLHTLLEIKNQKKQLQLDSFLLKSLRNLQPKISFRNKKVAGVVYKIPKPYQHLDRLNLASRWISDVARNGKAQKISSKIAKELLDANAAKGEGLKKKKEVHRLAIANRVNLKYM